MKLKYFHILNYRNLHNVEIYLNDDINFLVGENDLGKSNFLELLSTLFTKRNFNEDDFFNKNEEIRIEFQIKLEECERGAFDDLFNPEDEEQELIINIVAEQLSPEYYLEFTHKETKNIISYNRFRALNFIKNSSTNISKDEFDVHKNKGAGRFLNFLIKKFIEKNESSDFIKKLKNNINSKKLIKYTGNNLNNIDFFKKFEISVDLEGDIQDLLCRMLEIKAKNRDIKDSGHGIQYAFLIILFILEKIINIFSHKTNEDLICEEEDGKQSISLILALDEPEVHQHTYMQRSLIKTIKSIIKNENSGFLKLLKEHFNLDALNGQIIIVTHSPNIILSDYKDIVRFYKKKNKILVKSGAQIELDESEEKHLLMNFDFFKEAFFSRGIIIVEGKTEQGLIPILAEKVGVDFDELGISLISADSGDSIPSVMKLCTHFEIPHIALMDKDKLAKYGKNKNIFYTARKELEGDIVDKLEQVGKLHRLLNIHRLSIYSGFKTAQILNLKEIKKNFNYRIKLPRPQKKDLFYNNINSYENKVKKIMLLYWLLKNKSIILGRYMGNELDTSCIPVCINKVLTDIKNKVAE
jgi:putative ATP-dependent endonuclease of OLD family